jgi:hypothetical protein
MTDHTADGDIKDESHKASGEHSEASLVPDPSEVIPHEAKAADAPQESASAHAARPPSKEITLQRLTPHSSWEDYAFRDEATIDQAANAAPQAGRRMSIAAIVTIAAAVGAIGGSLATAGVGHYLKSDQSAAITASASVAAAEQARAADSAIAKINADIAALKSSSAAQSAKLAERIEKVEKAQAEPAAKLAKLSEAVDKLRAPAPVAAAAAPETTGSIKSTAAQPNRMPVVDGWVLREVSDGMATVVGRAGIFDVIPGDPLPGVGRVDAIRRQDGRWVVVTSRGLIVAR